MWVDVVDLHDMAVEGRSTNLSLDSTQAGGTMVDNAEPWLLVPQPWHSQLRADKDRPGSLAAQLSLNVGVVYSVTPQTLHASDQ